MKVESAVHRKVYAAFGGGLRGVLYETSPFLPHPVYAAVEAQSPGARVIIPPRKNAGLSPTAETSPTQRDEHLAAIERDGVFAWKRCSGYYAQSHAENAFSRFKRIFGGGLRAKRDESQERETLIACNLLNRMRELGRPQSYPVH